MWIPILIALLFPVGTVGVNWREVVAKHDPLSSSRIATWHTIQFPVNKSPNVRIRDESDDVSDDIETLTTEYVCNAECQGGTIQRNLTVSEIISEFAYEEHSGDGTKVAVEVDVNDEFVDYLNHWQDEEEALKQEEELKHLRHRRDIVIGDDTRFSITEREWLIKNPFSTTVKISTGCTGVLINPQYVLTAASCVHNGRKVIAKMRDLSVGFREKRQLTQEEQMGKNWEEAFRWIPVKKIFVPREWTSRPTNGKSGRVELPVDKNYALINLKRKVDRAFLNISVASVVTVGEGKRLHFSSFDDLETPALNYRYCRVDEETTELLYQQCDSTEQSVGAGVYVRHWDNTVMDWTRRVIAVFTGHQEIYSEDDGLYHDRNIAVKITPLKFAQICFWITGDYGQCRG